VSGNPAPRAGPTQRRRLLWLAALAFVLWWLTGFAAAWLATRPHPSEVPDRRELAGHTIESVATAASDGVTTRAWLVDASRGHRCVVLAAGIRGNRTAMTSRAEWYLAHGWSTLLVDLRGTGESAPERISMGYHEARDLVAWHTFLRGRGYAAIGAHGQSLGAAAAVYTAVQPQPPAWQFVVLEACYRDIDAALTARVPWLPACTLWPLSICAEWLVGVPARELAPLRAIAHLDAPTLIACGAIDRKVGPDAARLLFEASPARDKRHLDVAGVGHVDLWRTGSDLPRALGDWPAVR